MACRQLLAALHRQWRCSEGALASAKRQPLPSTIIPAAATQCSRHVAMSLCLFESGCVTMDVSMHMHVVCPSGISLHAWTEGMQDYIAITQCTDTQVAKPVEWQWTGSNMHACVMWSIQHQQWTLTTCPYALSDGRKQSVVSVAIPP